MTNPLGRWFGMAVLSLLVLAAPGCDSDSLLSPESISGTYNLISVNGESPPVVLVEEETEAGLFTFSILSGFITLTATSADGGTYEASLTFEESLDGESDTFTDGGFGTFTLSGNTITLDEDEEESIVGSVSGNRITLSLQDEDLGTVVLVLQR